MYDTITTQDEVVTVSIVGVGVNKQFTVKAGTDLADVLAEARIAAEDGGLQCRLNGEDVGPDYIPNDGDILVVVPPAVKLGA